MNFDGDGHNLPDGGLDLVSGAEFYPSGALTGFDYGNGQSFTQTAQCPITARAALGYQWHNHGA